MVQLESKSSERTQPKGRIWPWRRRSAMATIFTNNPFMGEIDQTVQVEETPWKKEFREWKKRYRQTHENENKARTEKEIQTAELLAHLISFPTVSSDGITPEYQEASNHLLNFVTKYLTEKGEAVGFAFNFAEYEENGVKSLVISTHPGKHFNYLCLAHYDVAGPYIAPKADGDELYGRGASDMKPGILVGMESLVSLAEKAAKGEDIPSFALALTGDEEIGSQNGAKPLFEKENYVADVAIVFDGGTPGAMSEGSKGIIVENVILHGYSAHGAYPSLAKGLNPVKDFWPMLISQIDHDFPIPDSEKNKDITISPAFTNGGHADNSTPAEMKVTFNNRFPTQESMNAHKEYMSRVLDGIYNPMKQSFQNRLEQIQTALQDTSLSVQDRRKLETEATQTQEKLDSLWYSIEKTLTGDVCEIDVNNPDNKRYRKIAQEKRGEEMPLSFDQGSSDIRFFGNRVKEIILTATLGSDNKHSHNESVNVQNLFQEVDTVIEFVSQKPQTS